MIARKAALGLVAICCLAAALLPAAAQGATPAWSLSLTPLPSNFAPGANPQPEYLAAATNIGGAAAAAGAVLSVKLPAGLTPTSIEAIESDATCTPTPPPGQEVSCQTNSPVPSGQRIQAQVTVAVTAAPNKIYDTEAQISGGGAAHAVSAISPTPVQAGPVPFDILPGFIAPLTDEDGAAVKSAGAHPFQATASFSLPTRKPGNVVTNAGYARNIWVELPRGLGGDPAATPVLCTEVQLTGTEGCPEGSQVGLADVTTSIGVGSNGVSTTPLYNMVPQPGSVAELATDIAGAGLYAHTLLSVRSDGDYGIEALVPDLLALGSNPIFGVQSQIWGDPSAAAHDPSRECGGVLGCPATKQQTALLTMPADCPGTPLGFEVLADSWEEPFPEYEKHSATYESAELAGEPVHVEDCGNPEVQFKPTIKSAPTTNLTDSPSGLDFTLHQPQDMKLTSRSPSPLRDATIRFPAGMSVNPSQAAGLGACSEAQIGFAGKGEEGALHFSKAPQSCPAAAKVGSLEATSPALVARNAEHKVEVDPEDPEGGPILEPLHGSVYLAQPFANPFGSLVAVYLVVEDKQTGIVAKLAGKGELDPQTGQLTTYVKESPELPIEDFKVHLFGGDRGAFITPPTCAKFTTKADLVPWSSPDGENALRESSFQTTAAPTGGPCPATEAQMPTAFKLSAGTESPAAGKYSPLLFKLTRQDGTQRLSRIEATLPTGLIAKLAGVGTCSEAAIAKARSREEPNKGSLEQADPSCPASSEVGTAVAGAGAGSPYYTTGHAYLAGPYKGAPVSVVTIAPAIAGPFDLGTVVVRAAVYLDPTTAQGRIVSDPLPSILDGVPLDVRSVAVRATRQNFTLNPTSCDEKSFGGQAVSTLGQIAPLFERFQVGGCKSLPYKPQMSVRLFGPVHRGGHPRLKAVFTAKPGEANTAAISFTFPRSEFIDQAHFRTICTRVQFAAQQCPAGSIYGHVKAISPLVDYPLEGPAYLRSSNHKLPDLVVSLHGPPSQPITVEAAGRVDSVNGGLRVRFESVPDAPLSKLIFSAQGAKKGLFQNSTNICKGIHRATLKLDAQSGKVYDTQPQLKPQCGKKGKGKKGKSGGGH
jgi:hypothetical protein